MNILVPLVVAIPLLGAALTLALGRRSRYQVAVSVFSLAAVVVISAILLVLVDQQGPAVVHVGDWQAPWGIVLVVDRLSAIMLIVSALMLLGVLLFAVGQGIVEGDQETPVSIFHPTYLVLAAGLFNAFIAGDLFNMYVGFEMLLSASYVLLTLGGTGARIRAGVTYIVVSLVSSILFLSAIALIYGATGTVTLALLAERIPELPGDVQLILGLMLLIAFSVKAAVFPLSFWLPDSYPTAPAPVTAVFAGLLTKVGVYAILRTQTLLFPDNRLQVPLMIVALLTMVIGILGALAQADIKRLLSFTLVSHIGYMIFGIAIGTEAAIGATIYYVVHHIMIQTTLFLCAGLIERIGGTTSLARLGGMLKAAPFVAILFFIGAMNLGGIPPFSGFLGKVALFDAGVQVGGGLNYLLLAGGAATSLLTLYALARAWNMAFWRPRRDVENYDSAMLSALQDDPHDEGTVLTKTTSPLMTAATATMLALTVCLTVFAGPAFDLAARAAANIEEPSTYIDAVFPGGAP
ncbi:MULTISPECIES: Na+/H+ antiporter subunit D [unclassified Cryobacterium]|uniref:Na+/H+ antiporter subunit D n=1 Tax=unclassified Cryobacterium TaxID=2649013 RepID=UPI00106D8314|nr:MULTISPECIES: Na+/H+ antiporter subunit D [unclassified Cryobacterium]TFC53947.1 Na+/H+ antiporter subunit D [Cryobacterium sp. TMB3-1-2]TFC73765.1 Na+/H+ antiporter subunit D [Cryobacterium sp. TMB3-15]TFC77702.1 Na+/H+ antiporter subunit D [Cryobacterium sp. TMB3-10]TFC91597.1 Na+/H+ antiporter subunit D [Cryobacterium sp. TMT4-31]TFD43008.1 Na+/H+ antiporter subunit D [Cryobacterium sp. TMB3-12]